MINFFKRLFRKDLNSIMRTFNRAHVNLNKYIDSSVASAEAAEEAARNARASAGLATKIRDNIAPFTSVVL